jgi:hypothetical protein
MELMTRFGPRNIFRLIKALIQDLDDFLPEVLKIFETAGIYY